MMSPFALAFCGLLALTAATGCADVKVRSPQPDQSAAYQSAPVDDGRTAASIRDENASLRETMRSLEQKHSSLASAVAAEEDRKDGLERRLEQVEKDRDRYEKLLKKDD